MCVSSPPLSRSNDRAPSCVVWIDPTGPSGSITGSMHTLARRKRASSSDFCFMSGKRRGVGIVTSRLALSQISNVARGCRLSTSAPEITAERRRANYSSVTTGTMMPNDDATTGKSCIVDLDAAGCSSPHVQAQGSGKGAGTPDPGDPSGGTSHRCSRSCT